MSDMREGEVREFRLIRHGEDWADDEQFCDGLATCHHGTWRAGWAWRTVKPEDNPP
jgi:hypothetical protein